MKGKILAALLVYIYIYTIAAPAVWALSDATSFNPEQIQVQAANNAVPIGTVIVWTKEEIPEGWLECNGQAVPDIYPDLKALMPNVPDYHGRFLEGNSVPGEIKEAGLPNITGSNGRTSFSTNTNYPVYGSFYWKKNSDPSGFYPNSYATMIDIFFDASLSNPIYGNAETVQPPAVTVKYLIKAE